MKVKQEHKVSSQGQDRSLTDASCSTIKEEEGRLPTNVKTEAPNRDLTTDAMAGRCTLGGWYIHIRHNANVYMGYRGQ